MIASQIAHELGVRGDQVQAALDLLAEGNTVPFIARYRKEATGGLDDAQLRSISERATYIAELNERKNTILAAIEEQGKLDDVLKQRILECDSKARLEDLYLPYKKRRKTKADKAREAGLEPLLDELIAHPHDDPEVLAQKYGADAKSALDGARAILTDRFALDADVVDEVRTKMFTQGVLRASVVEGMEEEGRKFKDYFEFSEPFTSLPSHRILALFRGEKEGVLHLDFDAGDDAEFETLLLDHFDLDPSSSWLIKATHFGWRTKLLVSAGLDTRTTLRERQKRERSRSFPPTFATSSSLPPLANAQRSG